jgi:hypothetical protein
MIDIIVITIIAHITVDFSIMVIEVVVAGLVGIIDLTVVTVARGVQAAAIQDHVVQDLTLAGEVHSVVVVLVHLENKFVLIYD